MAATLSLQLGEIQQHCEVLVRLNQWLTAIAMAPGVSIDYWRQLCAQYAHTLVQRTADPAEVTPFLVASGDARGAIHQLLQRSEHADAQALAQASASGLLPVAVEQPPPPRGLTVEGDALVALVAESRARLFEEESQPALAACCFLAHGQGARAVRTLLRMHELELSLALSLTLGLPPNDPLYSMLSAKVPQPLPSPPTLSPLLRPLSCRCSDCRRSGCSCGRSPRRCSAAHVIRRRCCRCSPRATRSRQCRRRKTSSRTSRCRPPPPTASWARRDRRPRNPNPNPNPNRRAPTPLPPT